MWSNKEYPIGNGLKLLFSVTGQLIGISSPMGNSPGRYLDHTTPRQYTWANRPTAGTFDGQQILINDPLISSQPVIARWNVSGGRWVLDPHFVNIFDTSQTSYPDNNVAENTVAGFTFQLGVLGKNGRAQLNAVFSSAGGSAAATSTIKLYVNGSVVDTPTTAAFTGTNKRFITQHQVQYRNTAASWMGMSQALNGSAAALVTGSRNQDTIQANIAVTHTWGAGGAGTVNIVPEQAFLLVWPQA